MGADVELGITYFAVTVNLAADRILESGVWCLRNGKPCNRPILHPAERIVAKDLNQALTKGHYRICLHRLMKKLTFDTCAEHWPVNFDSKFLTRSFGIRIKIVSCGR